MRAHPLLRWVPPELAGRAIAVGGVVRDALLGLPPGDDLDRVVEGPVPAPPGWVVHGRVGTASWSVHEGTVHLGMARRERYPAPGALPEVEPGTLADDLARRDLTVNAMALALGGAGAGDLIDPHGGLADLRAGLIRTLRADAFTEDPSRLVRAARYAGRLGFALEAGTRAAAEDAAPELDPGSARVAGELRRLLEEDQAAAAGLWVLRGLGVPWVAGDPIAALAVADRAADGEPVPRWAVRLGAAVAAPEDVAVPGWARAVARDYGAGLALAGGLDDGMRPSELDALLHGLAPGALVGARAGARDLVERWRAGHREAAIGGSDLVAAGIAPGPEIGRALAGVRAAVLDGAVGGRDEQIALALRIARGDEA